MDTMEIRCPSGMRGMIRKMTGRDFHKLLIDSPNDGTPEKFADMASAVWMETIDPGPYRFTGRPGFRTELLLGDRSHILLQSRIFTSGGKKQIRIKCEECGGWWSELFDYASIPVRAWPDADAPEPSDPHERKAWDARRRFAAGEPCSTRMPDGVNVEWRLLTGDLLPGPIRDFSQQFDGGSLLSEVSARVVSIEGIDLESMQPAEHRNTVFNWVTSYPDEDFWYLWNDIQDHECGPETDVVKRCAVPLRECGAEFGYTVDLMGFIMPSLPKRSLRSRAGAQTHRT